MDQILIFSILSSFLITLLFIPIWIKRAKKAGLVGKDIHKSSKKDVAEAGGIVVLFSFLAGVLSYIAIKTFVFGTNITTIEIFALTTTVLIAGIIGLIDDILGWKIGLNRKARLLFLFFAAIPLVAINAGDSTVLGIETGLFYAFAFIPIGVIGASATFNFLEGYNGLGASQGILILSALSIVTYFTGSSWLSVICLDMVVCLFAFYLFNKYPAKIFPGDSLTYSVGALIATMAILGNLEKISMFFFIPYIIETGLKCRGKLKKESFAKIGKNGGLELPYNKIYSLTHLSILLLKKIKRNKEVKEKEVVYLINFFQILVIGIGFLIFKNSIF